MRAALADNISGEAAKAAYYFFLSLFPLILVGIAGTAVIGGQHAYDNVINWMTGALPGEATEYVTAWLGEVPDPAGGGALSIGEWPTRSHGKKPMAVRNRTAVRRERHGWQFA